MFEKPYKIIDNAKLMLALNRVENKYVESRPQKKEIKILIVVRRIANKMI